MLDIKFKGYNKKNGKWLYGCYVQNRGGHFVCPDEFANGKTWEDYEIDPESLGQYTTIKDKGGNEIYGGDIIKFLTGQVKVNGEWVDNTEEMTVTFKGGAFNISSLSYLGYLMEVIGNEYDKKIKEHGQEQVQRDNLV